MCKLFYLPLSIKVARLVFLKGYLSSGGGQGGGSPGEQGAGGVQETGEERAGSLRWREAGEKFKRQSKKRTQ